MKTSALTLALFHCALSVHLVACGDSEARGKLADESTSAGNRPDDDDEGDGGERTPVDADTGARPLEEAGTPPALPDSDDGGSENLDAGVEVPVEVDASDTEPLRFADGAVVMFPEPEPPPPDPPEPGDALANGEEDAEDAGVGFAPDDQGLPFSSASLHVKIADGTYQLVEGLTPPDDRHESVINFVREEGGYHAYGLFPWDVTFLSFDAAQEFLPEGEEIVVLASRTGAGLRVVFEIDDRVFIRSVVVEEFEP